MATGKAEKYLISGLTQLANNLGRDCLFTRQGYERFGALQNAAYNINLAANTDIDAWGKEMQKLFAGNANEVINYKAAIDSASSVYVDLITMIVIAILVLSAIILSAAVGMIVSCLVINPLMALFFRSLGIVKCTFAIPVSFSVFGGIGLILLSFGIACLLSLKVKKITPRNLLAGE